ncbi:MAG: hypothetical protein CVU44_09000 [Chloroflexi bacterium HGW-Chloroflexi-6]|nr:MAG: hypothetical protein CVU44_09000 [Chloroflexi bacterium HGW-Chloroflexi-6]
MKPLFRLFWILLVLTLAQLACGLNNPASNPDSPAAEAPPATLALTQEAIFPTETGLPPQPAVAESRMLTVEFPPQIRAGDSDLIRLTLEVDELGNLTATAETAGNVTQGEVVQIPNIYETHNIVAEARLDMAGVEINPTGTISESLRPGQPVTFYWSVRAEEIGIYRGTLWFYLNFVPLAGGPEQRQALSAQKIEIEAVNFLGLKAQPARWLGAAGTLFSAVLGMPFLEGTLKWLWGRVRKPQQVRSKRAR